MNDQPKEAQIAALVRPIVEAMGGFLVEAAVRGEGGGRVVEVFADTDAGITADECASLSRTIGERLDADGLVKGRYHLVVSSPGVERPLKFFRQYPRNVGRRVEIVYRADGGAEARCNGTLVEAAGGAIGVRTGGAEEVRRIQADAIITAMVVPAW